MGSFIPRLIVHDEEVDKIYNPVREVSRRSKKITPIDSTAPDNGVSPKLERKVTIRQLAAGVASLPHQSTRALTHIASEVADLPHKTSHSWRQQFLLLAVMTLGSLAVTMGPLLSVPLASVNAGLSENRRFLYGVMTLSEFLGLIPWVETCNFALPEANIPVLARIVSVMSGLAFQKLFDAFIAEAWWSPGQPKVFPIPFSTVASGSVALPITLTVLYWMTPKQSNTEFTSKFRLCVKVLLGYGFSAFVIGSWAVVLNRLPPSGLGQVLWAFMYAPLRFVCKILLMSPLLTTLNPKRWIIMNLVPDVIFSRVLVATNPYIDGYPVFLSLELTTVLTLMWRYYNGVDRLAILWGSLRRWWKGENAPTEVADQLCANGRHIAAQAREVFRLSQRDITQMSMKLNGRAGPQTFVAWAEEADAAENISDPPSPPYTRKIEDFDMTLSLSSLPKEDDDSLSIDLSEAKNSLTSLPKEDDDSLSIDLSDAENGQASDLSELDENCSACSNSSTKDSTSATESTESDVIGLAEERPAHIEISIQDRGDYQDESSDESDADSDETDGSIREDPSPLPVIIPRRPVLDRRQFLVQQQQARESHRPPLDRRQIILKEQQEKNNELTEVNWQQRHLYHIEDSVGSETLTIIVRIQHMGILALLQKVSLGRHLNSTFVISPERRVQASIYGWTFLATSIVIISLLSLLYRKELGGRKLTLSRVTSYIYRDHFWFLFLWLSATASFSLGTMINHFGADFSLELEWLSCRNPGEMAWPACLK